MTDILILPDSHAHTGHRNDRFSWLGHYIVGLEKKPDIIVNLGDMFDGTSLSKYDVGKKSAEGHSYQQDLEAVWEANEFLFRPFHDFNKKQLRKGKKPYKPKKIMCLGNHCNRINRAANDDPKLHGWITTADLKYEAYGWTVVPFLTPYIFEDVVFQHYQTQGNMDTAVSGLNAARVLALRDGRSHIVGHSHLLQVARIGRGKVRWGISAGCYMEPEEDFKYVSKDAQQDWWRGIVILRNVQGADFEPEFVTLRSIKEKYEGYPI